MTENNRIDDFLKVAEQKYENNPHRWERLYNWLHEMLPSAEAQKLKDGWMPIIHKKDLEQWDEVFMECTINGDDMDKSLEQQVWDNAMMNNNPYNRHAFGWTDPLTNQAMLQQQAANTQHSQLHQQYSLALMAAQAQSTKTMKKSMAEKLFGKKE